MTQATDGLPSTNGPTSLSDRVKGLRLDDRSGSSGGGRSGSGWLPWTLCMLMAVTWASFAVRAYTSGGWKAIFGSKADNSSTAPVSPDRESRRIEKNSHLLPGNVR